jgi:hypothetical protein
MTLKIDEVVDYAYPCLMAERAVANLHKSALHNDFDNAIEEATIAITELRVAIASLKIMKEKYKG